MSWFVGLMMAGTYSRFRKRYESHKTMYFFFVTWREDITSSFLQRSNHVSIITEALSMHSKLWYPLTFTVYTLTWWTTRWVFIVLMIGTIKSVLLSSRSCKIASEFKRMIGSQRNPAAFKYYLFSDLYSVSALYPRIAWDTKSVEKHLHKMIKIFN